MPKFNRVAPCLWFDDQGEAAAQTYCDIFPNSRITHVARYGKAGFEFHRKPAGSVMTVAFELDAHPFTALNGGTAFKFTEAISLQVNCDTQDEIDHYWSRLSTAGDPSAQQCGWLKDKFGVSWQIVPTAMPELMSDPQRAERVMGALLSMKKLDLAALQRA